MLFRATAIAAFVAVLSVNPTKAADCGSIENSVVFDPGLDIVSCNSAFRLSNDGTNVVLYFATTGDPIWQTPTDNGAEFNFYTSNNPLLSTARLVVQDDGNVVINRDSGDGTETLEWSSGTKGTDCGQVFITDTTKNDLATIAENNDAAFASAIRANVCFLFSVTLEAGDTTVEDIGAEVAGPGALPGRTVITEYKFNVLFSYSPTDIRDTPIGAARLKKTWYYDGSKVSNAAGEDPAKASLQGEATTIAQILGFSWGGSVPGSDQDDYSPYKGNGKGAHFSSRTAFLKWEVPIGGSLVAFKPTWQQELFLKGFADGKVECRGGQSCLNAKNP